MLARHGGRGSGIRAAREEPPRASRTRRRGFHLRGRLNLVKFVNKGFAEGRCTAADRDEAEHRRALAELVAVQVKGKKSTVIESVEHKFSELEGKFVRMFKELEKKVQIP